MVRLSNSVYRDISAWYHVVFVLDTNNPTVQNRARIWINGVEITSWATNFTINSGTTFNWNSNTSVHSVGSNYAGGPLQYFDGYLTEVNFIDGQALTPASFGAIDSSTGVWAPRPYSGTYGTNGFYLKFANTSSVAALGNDSSGNNNTWTVNNVPLTAGATYDSMIDVPVNYSDGGNGRGNYAVGNPLYNDTAAAGTTWSGGNLNYSIANAGSGDTTFSVSSGKWYWEHTIGATSNALGVHQTGAVGRFVNSILYGFDGNKVVSGTTTAYGAAYTTNDIIGVAVDVDAGTVVFYKNNVSQGSLNLSTANITLITPFIAGGGGVANVGSINFGQRPFTYTPPAGFRALNTNNLPTPSIVNGANFMAATTYTGNAAARSLSNAVNSVSFQPDLVWIKSRTPGATNHALFDSTRGTTKYLSSNTTTGETTLAQSLTAFGADGFSLGTDTTLVNANANSYVAWQWKAGGAAVSNTQGTITSQVSANTTAGLSVVTYTGTGANATVGHGLGVAPKMVIVKNRSTSITAWIIAFDTAGFNWSSDYYQFDTGAKRTDGASAIWRQAPTSAVFSIGANGSINASSASLIAYCFAEIAGFSKFGSYTGNGLADGPFVFCGFRPRFVMVKAAVGGTGSWTMLDTSRDVFNLMDNPLFADLPDTETLNAANYNLDGLSNGFKLRTNGTGVNASGVTFIFAAFAETPSKYALAR